MNFKVGDIVKTRDGRDVEILKVDAPGERPIVGMFLGTGTAWNWPSDGRAYGEYNKADDLRPPKRTREVTVWVNVYPIGECFYEDETEAKEGAGGDALAVAVPHTFTLEYW